MLGSPYTIDNNASRERQNKTPGNTAGMKDTNEITLERSREFVTKGIRCKAEMKSKMKFVSRDGDPIAHLSAMRL